MVGANFNSTDNLAANPRPQLFNNSSTSLINGGVISVNDSDNTKFDISAGIGDVVNNYTDPANPIYKRVSWNNFNSITADFLLTSSLTRVFIDHDGNIVQKNGEIDFDFADARDLILLGILVHGGNVILQIINTITVPGIDLGLSVQDLSIAVGSVLNVGLGNNYTYNGNNLKLNRSSGKYYQLGISFKDNKKLPNSIMSDSESPVSFVYTWRYGIGRFTFGPSGADNTVIPSKYDDGTGGLGSPNGIVEPYEWTVNPIIYTTANNDIIQYGQNKYPDLDSALLNVGRDDFVLNSALLQSFVRGYLVVRGDATDLSDPDQARFIQTDTTGFFTLPVEMRNYGNFDSIVLHEIVDEPLPIANAGQCYTRSDNGLYFQDGDGIEHKIPAFSGSTKNIGGFFMNNNTAVTNLSFDTYADFSGNASAANFNSGWSFSTSPNNLTCTTSNTTPLSIGQVSGSIKRSAGAAAILIRITAFLNGIELNNSTSLITVTNREHPFFLPIILTDIQSSDIVTVKIKNQTDTTSVIMTDIGVIIEESPS